MNYNDQRDAGIILSQQCWRQEILSKSGPLGSPRETNYGPARHTAKTAIFVYAGGWEAGGSFSGPRPAANPVDGNLGFSFEASILLHAWPSRTPHFFIAAK